EVRQCFERSVCRAIDDRDHLVALGREGLLGEAVQLLEEEVAAISGRYYDAEYRVICHQFRPQVGPAAPSGASGHDDTPSSVALSASALVPARPIGGGSTSGRRS